MEKNYLVSKANDLITANYDLSLEEQRVILTLASTIQPDDEEFKPYKFRIKDFMSILGIKTKTKYTEIPKITKELMKKVIEIKKDNKIIQVAWLSSAEYEIASGTVELQFSPKLKPYFLKLKKLYTSYRLENILSLKSKYSIRIYEILKSSQFKGYVVEDLDILRNMVGASEYVVYANFKNRILKQSQKEINAKTDLSFEFEEIKTGRKVTSIKFIIKSCEGEKLNSVSSAAVAPVPAPAKKKSTSEIPNSVIAIMDEHKITKTDARKIYKAADGDLEKIKKCYKYTLGQDVENVVAYMVKLCKNFSEPISNKADKKPKNKFMNFPQRNYDFDAIEKMDLERNLRDAGNLDLLKK